VPTTDGIWRAGASHDSSRRWPVAEALVALILFCLALALFLAVRRMTGALVEPLPPLALAATATLALAWAWSTRAIAVRIMPRGLLRSLANWAPLAIMLVAAVACSYPGHRGIDWVVWAPAIAAAWLTPAAFKSNSHSIAGEPRSPVLGAPVERGSPAMGTEDSQGELLQQLTRVRLAESRDAVHGVLVAEFAAGQDIATLYVGFCPPFDQLPHVEAEVADGPAATIKIVQVLHNGARLDVALTGPASDATRVSVEFLAAEPGDTPATNGEPLP
jgi:hypothetical protein